MAHSTISWHESCLLYDMRHVSYTTWVMSPIYAYTATPLDDIKHNSLQKRIEKEAYYMSHVSYTRKKTARQKRDQKQENKDITRIWETWLIYERHDSYMRDMTHIWETWLIYERYERQDSYMRDMIHIWRTWLIYERYERHDSYMRDMTHIWETWLIYERYERHDSYMRDMTDIWETW
jgi:hypothetical protein